jgi:DNA-binding response OmpR family regulator
MRLLIAEDNGLFQKVLQQVLGRDHELVLARDGNEAWAALQAPDAPRLAILDWVMPGLTGPQVCRKVRACPALSSMYLIILTAKNSEADIVSGLRSGADDYLTKPPIPAELQARVRVGERILALQGMVEGQDVAADRASVRELPLRNLFVQDLTDPRLPVHVPCGVEACTCENCEPGDCCSISYTDTDTLMHRLLGV